MIKICCSFTHPEVGKERRVCVGEHGGWAHHGVAGTHGLHVRVSGEGQGGGGGVMLLEVLWFGPMVHGLESSSCSLGYPTCTEADVIDCGGVIG